MTVAGWAAEAAAEGADEEVVRKGGIWRSRRPAVWETIAAISMLVPVLMPAVLHAGIDPVQFGVIMILDLVIGLLTPPVGMVPFVPALISIFPAPTLYLPTLWYR